MATAMLAGNAGAVPPGKTAQWDAPLGRVVFDGKVHADKGLECAECHNTIFKMKRGAAKMRMADIHAGRFCGECHNGGKAFETNNPANCLKCHKTPIL